MLQYKKLLKENQGAILAILNKYKKHRTSNLTLVFSVDDFI